MGLHKRERKKLARIFHQDRTTVNTIVLIQHGVLAQDGKGEGKNYKSVVNTKQKKK